MSLSELEAAYRNELPRFRRVAAAIVGDEERALDAVQEAFGRAIRHRRSFAGRGTVDAWLWRLVVNAARDARGRVMREAIVEAAARGPTRAAENGAGDAGVAAALALLPERQRLVVFLRYYADLGYAAIAETLEISPGTVAATLNAAHKTLKQTLEEVVR